MPVLWFGGRNYGKLYRMEKVATDIYTFSQLRDMGFTYVDKTDALMSSGFLVSG